MMCGRNAGRPTWTRPRLAQPYVTIFALLISRTFQRKRWHYTSTARRMLSCLLHPLPGVPRKNQYRGAPARFAQNRPVGKSTCIKMEALEDENIIDWA